MNHTTNHTLNFFRALTCVMGNNGLALNACIEICNKAAGVAEATELLETLHKHGFVGEKLAELYVTQQQDIFSFACELRS